MRQGLFAVTVSCNRGRWFELVWDGVLNICRKGERLAELASGVSAADHLLPLTPPLRMNAINGQSEIEMPTSYRYHNDKATFHRNYDANRKCSPIMPLPCLAKPDCDGNCRLTREQTCP